MAQKTSIAPRLPAAPVEYDRQFMEQLTSILRLYFVQLDNPSPTVVASQGVGTSKVVSGLSCAQPSLTNPGQVIVSLPTQADFANLRPGDIYYDTSGGVATSYPLRIKA